MLEHIAGRPNTIWKRNQVLLLITFWLWRVSRGDSRGPRFLWIRRLNRYLTRFSPWQIVVTTLSLVYTLRNADSILGLGSPEPLARLYSPDFFRATWVTTALDAGFTTAMTIQPKFLRDFLSMVFFLYYLVYARDADEKLRRFRAICTVEMLRTTWNKTSNPYIRAITYFDRPRIPLLKRLTIPRPPGSAYTKPLSVTIFFSQSGSSEASLATTHEVMFDIPGGGFICMTPEHHEERLRRWTIQTGRPVVALDYGKAPEYPYPYALNEAFDLYRVLVESNGRAVGMNMGGDSRKQLKIVLSGDSAGSNLAVSLVNRIIETNSSTTSSQSFASSKARSTYSAYVRSEYSSHHQLPLPTALVLAYPALDFNFTSWMTKEHLEVLRTEHRAQTIQSRVASSAQLGFDIAAANSGVPRQSSFSTPTPTIRSRTNSVTNLRVLRNLAEGKDHLAHKSPLAVVRDVKPNDLAAAGPFPAEDGGGEGDGEQGIGSMRRKKSWRASISGGFKKGLELASAPLSPVLGRSAGNGDDASSTTNGTMRVKQRRKREERMRAVAAKGPATNAVGHYSHPSPSTTLKIAPPHIVPLLPSPPKSPDSTPATTNTRSPPPSPSAFTSRMRGRVSKLGNLGINTRVTVDGPNSEAEVPGADVNGISTPDAETGTSSILPNSSVSERGLGAADRTPQVNGYVVTDSVTSSSSFNPDVEESSADDEGDLDEEEDDDERKEERDYLPLQDKDKPLSARVLCPSDEEQQHFNDGGSSKRASHDRRSRSDVTWAATASASAMKPRGSTGRGLAPRFADELTASPLPASSPAGADANYISFERVAAPSVVQNARTEVVEDDARGSGTVAAVRKKVPIGTRLTMTSRAGYFQDRIVSPSMMRAMAILYIGPKRNPDFATDYYISPILTPSHLLVHFPPVLLVCGEKDPFVDDTVIFGGKVREAKRAKKAELLRNAVVAASGVPPTKKGGGSILASEALRMSSATSDNTQEDERLRALMYEDESDWVDMRILEGWGHGFLQMSATIMLGDSARRVINEMAQWIGEAFVAEREDVPLQSVSESTPTNLSNEPPAVAKLNGTTTIPLPVAATAPLPPNPPRKPASPKQNAALFNPGSPSPRDVPPPRHPPNARRASNSTARPRRPSTPSNSSTTATPRTNPSPPPPSVAGTGTTRVDKTPPRALTSADLPSILSETETETETERDRPLSFTTKKNRSPPRPVASLGRDSGSDVQPPPRSMQSSSSSNSCS